MKDKFKAVFNSFIEKVANDKKLENFKQTWLDKLKIEAKAVSNMKSEIEAKAVSNMKSKIEAKAVSNMKSEIEAIKDKESLRELLQQYCFLSNISLLKYLADKLDLPKSKQSIDELADEREEFYTSLLAEDFANAEIEDHEEMNNKKKVEYIDMIHTKVHIFKILFVKEDSSEIMLADIHRFLEKIFKDSSMFISIRKATVEKPNRTTIWCNLLLEGTQLFREALCSLGYSEKDITVSLYYTNYEHYLLLYRMKQLIVSIFQKVSDFTFRLFHIIVNVKYK